MWQYHYTDELYHKGKKGMKWGFTNGVRNGRRTAGEFASDLSDRVTSLIQDKLELKVSTLLNGKKITYSSKSSEDSVVNNLQYILEKQRQREFSKNKTKQIPNNTVGQVKRHTSHNGKFEPAKTTEKPREHRFSPPSGIFGRDKNKVIKPQRPTRYS